MTALEALTAWGRDTPDFLLYWSFGVPVPVSRSRLPKGQACTVLMDDKQTLLVYTY